MYSESKLVKTLYTILSYVKEQSQFYKTLSRISGNEMSFLE